MDRYEDGVVEAREATPDEDVARFVNERVAEAAERVNFHRRETERWERIGRACGAAVVQLEMSVPMSETTPGDFIGAASPQKAMPHPHH